MVGGRFACGIRVGCEETVDALPSRTGAREVLGLLHAVRCGHLDRQAAGALDEVLDEVAAWAEDDEGVGVRVGGEERAE
jgi:hypothetical protein